MIQSKTRLESDSYTLIQLEWFSCKNWEFGEDVSHEMYGAQVDINRFISLQHQ